MTCHHVFFRNGTISAMFILGRLHDCHFKVWRLYVFVDLDKDFGRVALKVMQMVMFKIGISEVLA